MNQEYANYLRTESSDGDNTLQLRLLHAFKNPDTFTSRIFQIIFSSSSGLYEYLKFNNYQRSLYFQRKRVGAFDALDNKAHIQLLAKYFDHKQMLRKGIGSGDGWFEIFMIGRVLRNIGIDFTELQLYDISIHGMQHSEIISSRSYGGLGGFKTPLQHIQKNFSWDTCETIDANEVISFINRFNTIHKKEDRDRFLFGLMSKLGDGTAIVSIHTANNEKELRAERDMYETEDAKNLYTFFAPYLVQEDGEKYENPHLAQEELRKKVSIKTKVRKGGDVDVIVIERNILPGKKIILSLNDIRIELDEHDKLPLIGESLRFTDKQVVQIQSFFKQHGYMCDVIKAKKGCQSFLFIKKKKRVLFAVV